MYKCNKTISYVASDCDDTDEDDCDKEWENAYERCRKLPMNSRLRGGHKTEYGCAKGFVSERSGGNPVFW